MVGLDFTTRVFWEHVTLAGYTLPVLAQVATEARKGEGARIRVSVSFVAAGPVRATPTRIILGLMLGALAALLTQALEMRAVWWALLGLERALDMARARDGQGRS